MIGITFLFLLSIIKNVNLCAILYDESTGGFINSRPSFDYLSSRNYEDYGNRLQIVRDEMSAENLTAILVLMDDIGRLAWISGFTGSAGSAVITMDKALLWTDGRYFLQASQQLNKNWTLMKSGELGVPNFDYWVTSGLKKGSIVGTDPRLINAEAFLDMKIAFQEADIQLISTWKNIIEMNDISTNLLKGHVIPHPVVFAGKSWQEKVFELRNNLSNLGVDYLVVSESDEIAWLFNLRAKMEQKQNRLIHSPTFPALAIIGSHEIFIWLQLSSVSSETMLHMNSETCILNNVCVKIGELNNVFEDIKVLSTSWKSKKKISLTKKSVFQSGGSYAIYESLNGQTIQFDESPIIMMKAVKNDVEVESMIKSSLEDSASLAIFFSFMENEIQQGKIWTEISASQKLEEIRQKNLNYKGPSFSTISAYGPHGSIIHYNPQLETDVPVGNGSMYLVDSGGQYSSGCTTDVTRTFHYGIPTTEEVSMYTRVLMGAIDLARLHIPSGSFDVNIDVIARQHLFEKGLNYKHNTGHGIGAYLEVHENPVSLGFGRTTTPGKLLPNMFFSDEPGFYKDNQFGIRLETILRTVLKTSKDSPFGDFIYFDPVSLVPFEPNLIDYSLMSVKQLEWLDNYNSNVRNKVGSLLKASNHTQALEWILKRTKNLIDTPSQNEEL